MRTAMLAVLGLLASGVLLGLGCDDDPHTDDTIVDDTDVVTGDPVVRITGEFYLLLGEQSQLVATTVNSDETAYDWSTSDALVANVDPTGLVTAIGLGEVTITATGTETGASDDHGITVAVTVPHYDEWFSSGHADRTAEAFRHWDGDGEVSSSCARCHSTPGYLDYLGQDGTTPWVVDNAAPLGTTIECTACHNDVASSLDAVTFPSGDTVTDLGPEARCLVCHQGRKSSADVDTEIAENASPTLLDTPDSDLGFQNIHYYAAGATLYAAQVSGGYQYPGRVYDYKFRHASGKQTCVECHDAHTLELKLDECAECHTGVVTSDDLKDIRMEASLASDYDADGFRNVGIYYEIEGLRGHVLDSIQQYAFDKSLSPICYGANHPYWFIDSNDNGVCDGTEDDTDNGGVAYNQWTPRLLKAAYNYQTSVTDPGNYAHNAKYTIQLLYDSLADLNTALLHPLTMSAFVRNDPGHFDGAGDAARHWDDAEVVQTECSKCHGGAEGLDFYLRYGVSIQDLPQPNGLECETCHLELQTFTVKQVDSVLFPSGIEVEAIGSPNNLCGTCHSGRASKKTVDDMIAASDFGPVNVHYKPAAATRIGTAAKVGYEYAGKTYSGPWDHPASQLGVGGANDCVYCHDPPANKHTFQPRDTWPISCNTVCHSGWSEPSLMRGSAHAGVDYDGDGDDGEPTAAEIYTLEVDLLSEIWEYSIAQGKPICHGSDYPYWFADSNVVDGMCDATETTDYDGWDAKLMRATFNYHYASEEPGAWAHNFPYMAQLLIDSIVDLDPTRTDYVRPTP